MPIRIDHDLLRASLREEDMAILDRVQSNVDRAVERVVNDFAKAVSARVADFQSGHDVSDAAAQKLQALHKEMEDGVRDVAKNLEEIRSKLLKAADPGASEGLKAALADLTKTTTDLQDKVKALHDRASKLGETTGGAMAGILRAAIG